MKKILLNGIICLLTLAFTSCNQKKEIKDIGAVFPDRIELKYSAIKGVEFFADTTGKGKPVTFDDLGITDSTMVIISQRKIGKIQSTGSDTSGKGAANLIPCCTIVSYYENVPVLVPCKICFLNTQPYVDDNTSKYKSIKKEIGEIKQNSARIKFICFDGAIVINTGKVRCERCPGRSQICFGTYILDGHEYPANFGGTPDDRYLTRREQGSFPCGNCPEGTCTTK